MFETEIPNHSYNMRNRNEPRIRPPNTSSAECSLKHTLPRTVTKMPACITDKVDTHSIDGHSKYIKKYFINEYNETCILTDCYVCGLS